MRTATIIFLAFAALAVGVVIALPSAAAAHCGTSITENSHTPDATEARRPLIQVVFDDSPGTCGVLSFSIVVDGVERNSEASATTSGSQYVVEYTPAQDLSIGSHSVSVTLTEVCCNTANTGSNVGAASWSFAVTDGATPELRDNPNGTCTAWYDENDNEEPDPAELPVTLPCPNPQTTSGPGGSTIVYDDKDNDGTMDPGEEIARTPNARTRDNPNGSCTLYDDKNANGAVDSGETLLTYPCPNVKTRQNSDGTTTVYDDKDNDGTVDAGESIATVGPGDADRDGVPDATEAELCARAIYRDAIAAVSPNAGECATSTDYVAPERFGGFNLPSQVVPGADLDGDTFPVTITMKRQRLIVQPFDVERVILEPAPDLVLPVDSDDGNPNVPAQSIVSVPFPVVTGYQMGQDADRDGVPVSLTLTKTWYTYDRRAPASLGTAPAPSDSYPMDPNDADKNVPAQSVFGPIKVPTETYGVDRDGDRIPGNVTVTYLDVTVDRTAANPITTETHSEWFEIDPDDDTRGAPPVNLDTYDGDRDDLPDALEIAICLVQDENRPVDGDCAGPTDYRAPATIPNPWRRS